MVSNQQRHFEYRSDPDLLSNTFEYDEEQIQFLLPGPLARLMLYLRGVSVVPTIILLCQGTANKTRLSSVLGIMIAVSDGRNSLSKTIWIPWLIVTRSSAFASSIFKIESVNTPVALMTAFALTSYGEKMTHHSICPSGIRRKPCCLLSSIPQHSYSS